MMLRASALSFRFCNSSLVSNGSRWLTATSAISAIPTLSDALGNVSDADSETDTNNTQDVSARSSNGVEKEKRERIENLRLKRAEMTTQQLPFDESNLHALAAALHERENTPSLTFLMGGPGSGKGTLSEMITSRTQARHVSVGALLRELTSRRNGSAANDAEARRISAEMSRGGVLSAELATRILLRHLYYSEFDSDREGERIHWLVDGFPRSFANAVLLDTLHIQPAVVIALEIDDATMRRRLARRARRDDVDYIIDRRFTEFRLEWESIKEFYKRRKLIVEVDADGSPEQVWQRYLDGMVAFKPPLLSSF